MYLFELNVETWKIKKVDENDSISYFVQNDPDLPNWFFTLILHF